MGRRGQGGYGAWLIDYSSIIIFFLAVIFCQIFLRFDPNKTGLISGFRISFVWVKWPKVRTITAVFRSTCFLEAVIPFYEGGRVVLSRDNEGRLGRKSDFSHSAELASDTYAAYRRHLGGDSRCMMQDWN